MGPKCRREPPRYSRVEYPKGSDRCPISSAPQWSESGLSHRWRRVGRNRERWLHKAETAHQVFHRTDKVLQILHEVLLKAIRNPSKTLSQRDRSREAAVVSILVPAGFTRDGKSFVVQILFTSQGAQNSTVIWPRQPCGEESEGGISKKMNVVNGVNVLEEDLFANSIEAQFVLGHSTTGQQIPRWPPGIG